MRGNRTKRVSGGFRQASAIVLLMGLPGLVSLGAALSHGASEPEVVATGEAEEKLRTAFIYQFTRYIEWPEKAARENEAERPFVIGVVADPEMARSLDVLAAKKTIKGRKVQVTLHSDVTEGIRGSDLVFVGSGDGPGSGGALLSAVQKRIEGLPILTVSQGAGFAQLGVMINFVREEHRLRFEINRVHLEKHGLKASSQLLKLAKAVIE